MRVTTRTIYGVLIKMFFFVTRKKLPARVGLLAEPPQLRSASFGSRSSVAGRRRGVPPENRRAHSARLRPERQIRFISRDV